MKTSSIRKKLELMFGFKDIYLKEELDLILDLTINRFDIDGKISSIDYNELLLFNNLESLILDRCNIDDNVINNVVSLSKLKSLSLFNCEFINNPEKLFNMLNLKNLYIDNVIFDLNLLENNLYDSLILSNITINKYFNINVNRLDIKKCLILDFSFLSGNIKTLIVSEKQYQNYLPLQQYLGHMIIMENNGQMVLKEVNK